MKLTRKRRDAEQARQGRTLTGPALVLHRTFLGSDLPTPLPAERAGQRRARALFAHVPRVTVVRIGPDDYVRPASAKGRVRAMRPGRSR